MYLSKFLIHKFYLFIALKSTSVALKLLGNYALALKGNSDAAVTHDLQTLIWLHHLFPHAPVLWFPSPHCPAPVLTVARCCVVHNKHLLSLLQFLAYSAAFCLLVSTCEKNVQEVLTKIHEYYNCNNCNIIIKSRDTIPKSCF